DEPKNEVIAPLESPTQVNTFSSASEIVKSMDEPFIKSETEPSFSNTTVVETPKFEEPVPVEVPRNDAPLASELSFDWEISATESPETSAITEESPKEEVVRHMLVEETDLSVHATQTKQVLSPEEQQRKAQERMSKIQDYTSKLKKAEGISEFENEPAFVRRNIQLNMSKPSTEENYSRFGLSTDEDRTVLRNNNFLHDNVD
ncbi:MAG: hypothetical protein ACK45H_00300, partial [Bacteroidota bacterium]